MAGREPSPDEAREGIYRRTGRDFWHGKGKFWVSAIPAFASLPVSAIVLPSDWWLARLGVALLGVVVGFLVGLGFCLGWHFVRSPFRQRDDARRLAERLTAEIEARNRIEFSVAPITPEITGRDVMRADRTQWHQETVFYVEVTHLNGPPPEFSANFSNFTGAVGLNGNDLKDYRHSVAWEDDYKAKRLQFGFHGHERLLVARSFRAPMVFWMVIPESQAWNQNAHGEGWPLVPLGDRTVTFELEVVNETELKSVTELVTIKFAADGSVERFDLTHLRTTADAPTRGAE
jgi:hypothetical protein